MARLDDLVKVRQDTLDRLASRDVTDQNFVMLGRLLVDVVKQIDELDPAATGEKGSALSEFQRRLAEREATTKSPRRSASK